MSSEKRIDTLEMVMFTGCYNVDHDVIFNCDGGITHESARAQFEEHFASLQAEVKVEVKEEILGTEEAAPTASASEDEPKEPNTPPALGKKTDKYALRPIKPSGLIPVSPVAYVIPKAC